MIHLETPHYPWFYSPIHVFWILQFYWWNIQILLWILRADMLRFKIFSELSRVVFFKLSGIYNRVDVTSLLRNFRLHENSTSPFWAWLHATRHRGELQFWTRLNATGSRGESPLWTWLNTTRFRGGGIKSWELISYQNT